MEYIYMYGWWVMNDWWAFNPHGKPIWETKKMEHRTKMKQITKTVFIYNN